MEFDVAQDRESHEEDKSGVEENKSGLDYMTVVCQSARSVCRDKSLDLPNRIKQAEKTEMAMG